MRYLKQPVWSNCVFWIVFLMFGQPLLILLYTHAILSKQPQAVQANTVLIPAAPASV